MNRKQRRASGKSGGGSGRGESRDPRLERAMALHQAARYLEADAVYRQILTDKPKDRDALRLRGALAYQIGSTAAAAELLAAARQADPKNTEVLTLLGLALEGAGNPEAAERAYREGLALDPRAPELWNNLGALLRETGRIDQALDAFRKALAARQDYDDARQNLAVTLFHAGRTEESLIEFETALDVRPGDPELLLNHGVVLNAAGRVIEAIASFKDALRSAPTDPDILTNLSAAYLMQGEFDEAERHARDALTAAPDSPGAVANLAMVLVARRSFGEAEALYHEALRAAPEYADVWSNYGEMLLAANRPAEAAVAYRKAEQFAPDDPRHVFRAGLCALSRGDLSEGWTGHEAGTKSGDRVLAIKPTTPRWTGDALGDRSLLIVPEQGTLSEIEALSCIPDAIEAAGKDSVIHLGCDPRLMPLIRRAFPSVTVFAHDGLDEVLGDVWIPRASLPGLFRRALEDFPKRESFLKADPDRVAEIDSLLPARGEGLRIGLAWRKAWSTGETTDLAPWDDILDATDAVFIGLQDDATGEELARRSLITVPGLDPMDDLDGVAALLVCCDLVLDMGTTAGDMAGALGVPCWSLSSAGNWTALGTDRHPFFPTRRVFWRGPDEEWGPVIARVAAALQREVTR